MQLNPFHRKFLVARKKRQVREKRNNWFKNYHQIDGKAGQRDLSFRKQFFQTNDFFGKRVLDVGCNTGQMCRFAAAAGASEVVGVDFDKVAIEYAQQNNSEQNVYYLCDDVDNYFTYVNLPKFDTALLLSIIGTKEIDSPMGMLAKTASCTEVLYLEGHHTTKYKQLLQSILKFTNFSQIEFIGLTFDNANYKQANKYRHLFRCSNQTITADDAVGKICQMLHRAGSQKIAVVGNAGVGKTTIRRNLIKQLNDNGFNFVGVDSENNTKFTDDKNRIVVVDDITKFRSAGFEKVVYFDYRALKYSNADVDTVFFLKYDIETRLNSKLRTGDYKLQRSPNGIHNHACTIKKIYTVSPFHE